MKTVLLLLSADRFAIPLIDYLVSEGKTYGWKIMIGSMFDQALYDRIKDELCNDISFVLIKDEKQCDKEIRKVDVVIGIMPDILLLKVADSCIARSKTLISPAKLNRQMFAKRLQAEENDALILLECGFTPGLDHITAKKMIDHIHAKGGNISSFKTYSGSLVAGDSIDNPLEFKLTSTASDLLNFGKSNNRNLIHGQLQHIPYQHLFSRAEPLDIQGLNNMAIIPEEDALYCRKIYGLAEATTVLKGRIVRGGFENFWSLIVRLGLTNTTNKIEMLEEPSYKKFLRSLLPYSPTLSLEDLIKKFAMASDEDIEKLKWLGFFDETWFEGTQTVTPANILQFLMEEKLSMHPLDKDYIVIRHELEYSLNNYDYKFNATLISEGEDQRHSALTKAIGLTIGSAARAVLLGNIRLKGVHTPIKKEIYEPVLNELEDLGIAFAVEEQKTEHVEQVH
jgi:saccharopine dehydrogenase (NADP+, L-glutamate forming)